jgi:hypothetical protein
MAGEKGMFRRIADTVRGAVAMAAGGARDAAGPGSHGAGPAPELKPQSKATRKAAQKATIARAEETRQKATDAVRATRRRRG